MKYLFMSIPKFLKPEHNILIVVFEFIGTSMVMVGEYTSNFCLYRIKFGGSSMRQFCMDYFRNYSFIEISIFWVSTKWNGMKRISLCISKVLKLICNIWMNNFCCSRKCPHPWHNFSRSSCIFIQSSFIYSYYLVILTCYHFIHSELYPIFSTEKLTSITFSLLHLRFTPFDKSFSKFRVSSHGHKERITFNFSILLEKLFNIYFLCWIFSVYLFYFVSKSCLDTCRIFISCSPNERIEPHPTTSILHKWFIHIESP